MTGPTVLIVPGLRDHVDTHWQTHLAKRLTHSVTVPPMGREDLSCSRRVDAIELAMGAIAGGVVIVAHSGGCIALLHWARQTAHAHRVVGALLATPPDFDRPLPEGYPALETLREGGWLPMPRARLGFPSLVATSDNDPLASFEEVQALAHCWGSETVHLGPVGHLNPASGFGEWNGVLPLIERLSTPHSASATVANRQTNVAT